MSEANTPQRAKEKSRGAKQPGRSDKKGPCREEQQGMTCSDDEPGGGATAQDAGKGTKKRHDPEEQRPGSTESAPG